MQQSLPEIAHSVLPVDDSAYQWSEIRSGFTLDPEQEAQHLFNRFVCYYEGQQEKARRGDEDVWSAFSAELRDKKLARHLEEKTLETADYSCKFPKTYKNGKHHLLQSLSFDHKDKSKITEKAVTWRGRASALEGAEPHEFWFLIGDVEGEARKAEVEKALNILNSIKAPKRIIYEKEKERFSEELGAIIDRAHG